MYALNTSYNFSFTLLYLKVNVSSHYIPVKFISKQALVTVSHFHLLLFLAPTFLPLICIKSAALSIISNSVLTCDGSWSKFYDRVRVGSALGLENLPQKSQTLPLRLRKISLSRVKDRSASFLHRVIRMVWSCYGPSLFLIGKVVTGFFISILQTTA